MLRILTFLLHLGCCTSVIAGSCKTARPAVMEYFDRMIFLSQYNIRCNLYEESCNMNDVSYSNYSFIFVYSEIVLLNYISDEKPVEFNCIRHVEPVYIFV